MVELRTGQAQNIADIARQAEADFRRCKLFGARHILYVNY